MPSVQYLVVAGGGGGGGGPTGGGGGAGGYRTNGAYDYAVVVGSYTVTVGAGGAAGSASNRGGAGNDSVFDTITSLKGGGGGGANAGQRIGGDGGSGGGGEGFNANSAGGAGTAGQGNNGGAGNATTAHGEAGGGGGASAVGGDGNAGTSTGGKGGDGTASTISGSSVTYAGGGGGSGTTSGSGGAGGGGNGQTNAAGSDASANTGGGGGGAGGANAGGAGGSGIVIVRYLTAEITATGGTITTDGAYSVHSFTSSGTFTVTALPTPSTAKTGGKGDNEKKKTLHLPVKPNQLGVGRRRQPPDGRKTVDERIEDSRAIEAEVAGRLAKELKPSQSPPVASMTQAEVRDELSRLLAKKTLSDNETITVLLLMAATI